MTKTRDLSDFLIEGGADLPLENAHIIPGVLYPGYDDKQIDGTTALAASTTGPAGSTVTSSKYGTVQSDNRMYYYTDIKGSKPIKDPRIGAYFGSQRHKTKSLQLLEQETATHGKNIYSVDGREWCRGYLGGVSNGADFGEVIYFNGTDTFLEIVGYFSDANIQFHNIAGRNVRYTLDGTDDNTNYAGGVTVTTPQAGRYVEAGGVENLGLGATLGIHTLKIRQTTAGHGNFMIGFELIAQDTSSTANKSKIQIPAQNVVSFGKKFPISATATHYDPFNGFTSGNLASVQALGIDTDTSLGLSKWLLSGTYYRPFNGGRVVKWVDSSGVIKTSVTMMPPNAKSKANSASPSNAFATRTTASHYATNNAMNSFEAGTDLDSDGLSELAKSFYMREFGNGSANGGSGGTYADLSMIDSTDDAAYVMDDGLTSVVSTNNRMSSYTEGLHRNTSSGKFFHTFIGTGIGRHASPSSGIIETWAQNLPYGTHVLTMLMDGTDTSDWYLDGVRIYDNSGGSAYYHNIGEQLQIYQPKRPPIPEDCVVLSDYMLMADFVPQPTAGIDRIPKGVRFQAQSRDYKIDKTAGTFITDGFKSHDPARRTGQYFWYQGAGTYTQELPFFGDSFVCHFSTESDSDYAAPVFTLNGSALSGFTNTGNGAGFSGVTAAGVVTETGNASSDSIVNFKAGAGTLGTNKLKVSIVAGTSGHYHYNRSFSFATPIHTSSHYQTFETPYLKELVGGDRNMEQMNLVCSPDGKTWDEITRDTSYLGTSGYSLGCEIAHATTHEGYVTFSNYRGGVDGVEKVNALGGDGSSNKYKAFYTKDFAIAYDRIICLRDGHYAITVGGHVNAKHVWLYINNLLVEAWHYGTNGSSQAGGTTTVYLKRGDYIQRKGGYEGNDDNRWSKMTCARLN